MKLSTSLRALPRLLALGLLASAATVSHAAYLVDTGTPNLAAGGSSLDNYMMEDFFGSYLQQQHLAASFTLESDSTVTSLGAFMYNYGSGGVTYELHQGGPTGSLVYSGNIASVGSTPDFYTISGMDLAVTAGTYTLNFLASYGFNGYMTVGAPASPDALTAVYYSTDATTWSPDFGSYGVQVGGTVTPVAVPEIDGALLPQALALVGASALLFRRRKSQVSG